MLASHLCPLGVIVITPAFFGLGNFWFFGRSSSESMLWVKTMAATRSCPTNCPCKSGYRGGCKKQLLSEYRILAGHSAPLPLWSSNPRFSGGPRSQQSCNTCGQPAARSTLFVAMLASLEPRSGAVVHVWIKVNMSHVMQTVMHCVDTSPKVGYRGEGDSTMADPWPWRGGWNAGPYIQIDRSHNYHWHPHQIT